MMYVGMQYRSLFLTFDFCSSYSCLIDEGETFVLTGGTYSLRTATRYTINGWQEDLERLNTPRRSHGCARYSNVEGYKVGSMNPILI